MSGPDVICSRAVFHDEMLSSMGKSTCLLGGASDLASACKQLAIADESSKHSYL